MQVEDGAAENHRKHDRLLGCAQQFGRPLIGDQVAREVAGHRCESGATGRERGDILVLPVPNLDGEARVVDPLDPFKMRQVNIEHLGACGEGKAHTRTPSSPVTRSPVVMESMAA